MLRGQGGIERRVMAVSICHEPESCQPLIAVEAFKFSVSHAVRRRNAGIERSSKIGRDGDTGRQYDGVAAQSETTDNFVAPRRAAVFFASMRS
jgi:hypothetical protein